MESFVDKFVRKVVREIHPMWYLYYCWRKSYTDKRLDGFIQKSFTSKDGDLQEIKRMMKKCWLWRGIHHSDFHEMSLDKMSVSERKQFVPRWEEVDLYYQVNNKRYRDLLVNKDNCYELFKDYYKRQVVSISLNNVKKKDAQIKITDFIKTHDRFIIKPIRLQSGKGIRIIDTRLETINMETFLSDCMKIPEYSNGLLLEELIAQDNRMASLHPESVNTIRITTINYGDIIEIKWPVLRIGRGDSFLDTSAAGGIFAAIDENTGITIRAADKQRGSSYQVHPDTQKPLIGFQIPLWDELCETIRFLASKCPDCHIMGWDMALTENGWSVVECSYGPEIVIQWALNRGVRNEFEEVKKRLHAKRGRSYKNKLLEEYLSVPLN